MAIKKIHEEKNGVIGYVITKEEDLEKLPKNGIAITSRAILVNPTIGVKTYIFYDNDTDKNTDGEWIEWKAKYRGLGDNVKDFIKEYHEDLNKIVDVTNPKIGEGYNVTINGSEEGVLSFEVNGRTLQNLAPKIVESSYSSSSVSIGTVEMFKPSTLYTIMYEIKGSETLEIPSNKVESMFRLEALNSNSIMKTVYGYNGTITTTYVQVKETFTTTSDIAKINFNVRNAFNDYNLTEYTLYIKNLVVLEGDYTNMPIETLPFVEGIQSVGDTTKNLLDIEMFRDINNHNSETTVATYTKSFKLNLKPNTSYVLSKRNTANLTYYINLMTSDGVRTNLSINNRKEVVKTTLDDGVLYITIQSVTQDKIDSVIAESGYLQLEEGKTATPYEPYHKGYKVSCKSFGKNLYYKTTDLSLTYNVIEISDNYIKTKPMNSYSGFGVVNNLHEVSGKMFEHSTPIIKDKTYSYSCKIRRVGGVGRLNYFNFYGIIKGGSYKSCGLNNSGLYTELPLNEWVELKFTNTATISCQSVIPYFQVTNEAIGLVLEVKDIQLEEGSQTTEYEPYQESTYNCLLDEPLRQLPNGVCDTIEKDKVVRRVGKVVLDGSEEYTMSDNLSYKGGAITKRFALRIPMSLNPFICDKLKYVDFDNIYNGSSPYDTVACFVREENSAIIIGKGDFSTIDELKSWLASNNVTVYYALATPTEEQLSTIPTINSYNDVTHIYSTNYIQPFIEIFDTVSIFKDANQYLNIECDRTFTLPNMDDLEDNAVKEIHMYIYMKEEATLTFPSDIKWETLSEFGKGDYVEIILTYVKTNGVGQWLGSAIVYNG